MKNFAKNLLLNIDLFIANIIVIKFLFNKKQIFYY